MDKKLKLFTCLDHDTHWPIGGASIIIAEDKRQARRLLDEALDQKDLKTFQQDPYTLKQVRMDKAIAIILRDGEY